MKVTTQAVIAAIKKAGLDYDYYRASAHKGGVCVWTAGYGFDYDPVRNALSLRKAYDALRTAGYEVAFDDTVLVGVVGKSFDEWREGLRNEIEQYVKPKIEKLESDKKDIEKRIAKWRDYAEELYK